MQEDASEHNAGKKCIKKYATIGFPIQQWMHQKNQNEQNRESLCRIESEVLTQKTL